PGCPDGLASNQGRAAHAIQPRSRGFRLLARSFTAGHQGTSECEMQGDRTMQARWSGVLFFLGVLGVLGITATSHAGDWWHWRGPTANGVSPETGLPEKFSLDATAPNSNLIWRAPYGCRSTPLVMNGRVYLINNAGEGVNEQERVLCLDADKGTLIWEHKF